MLLLDTETDAQDPAEAQLVQLALIHLSGGERRFTKVWLCQPRRPIPDEATGVHKISTEHAMAWGEPIETVIPEVRRAIENRWDKRTVLVGSNINYDLTVLDREYSRILGPEHAVHILGPVVDTLLLDKRVDTYRPGSRKLADQCTYYGLTLGEDAHDAAADALAAGQLAWVIAVRCIKRRWPRGRYGPSASERQARELIALGDALALHEAQKSWHEEGQRGLAEYWRSPKALEKTWEKVARGELTQEQADVLVAELPAMADRVEAQAVGHWPVHPRALVTT
jgi:DNA polymerase III subunit epsilon